MWRDTWKATWDNYHLSIYGTHDCKKRSRQESRVLLTECTFKPIRRHVQCLTSIFRFLLAQIYLNSLDAKPTPIAIRNAMKSFQRQNPASDEDKKLQSLSH